MDEDYYVCNLMQLMPLALAPGGITWLISNLATINNGKKSVCVCVCVCVCMGTPVH